MWNNVYDRGMNKYFQSIYQCPYPYHYKPPTSGSWSRTLTHTTSPRSPLSPSDLLFPIRPANRMIALKINKGRISPLPYCPSFPSHILQTNTQIVVWKRYIIISVFLKEPVPIQVSRYFNSDFFFFVDKSSFCVFPNLCDPYLLKYRSECYL